MSKEPVVDVQGIVNKAKRGAAAVLPEELSEHGELRLFHELVALFTAVALTTASIGALTLEVFLRFRFGERYLTLWKFFVASMFMGFYLGFAGVLKTLVQAMTPIEFLKGSEILFVAYFYLFCVAFFVHFAMIRKCIRKGELIHSRSSGQSYPLWRRMPLYEQIGEFGVQVYLEPLAVLPFGVVAFMIDPATGILILFGAIFMVVKAQIIRHRFRDAILDQIDADIESEAKTQALEQARTPAQPVRGYVMPVIQSHQFPPSWRMAYKDTTEAMEPGLQTLLTEPPPQVPDGNAQEPPPPDAAAG